MGETENNLICFIFRADGGGRRLGSGFPEKLRLASDLALASTSNVLCVPGEVPFFSEPLSLADMCDITPRKSHETLAWEHGKGWGGWLSHTCRRTIA